MHMRLGSIPHAFGGVYGVRTRSLPSPRSFRAEKIAENRRNRIIFETYLKKKLWMASYVASPFAHLRILIVHSCLGYRFRGLIMACDGVAAAVATAALEVPVALALLPSLLVSSF